MTTIPSPAAGMRELGEYLRQQRVAANLSVRQLSAVTGISNPYLSQIERGLRRPSADILQQLAQGLSLSAESLYIRAGLLDPERPHGADARIAIRNDPRLDGAQRRALLDAYAQIVGDGGHAGASPAPSSSAYGLVGSPPQHTHESEEMSMNAKAVQPGDADRELEKSALTPLYAVVGASDLAVEKLVELGQKAAHDAENGIDDLQQRADHLQHRANRDVAKAIKGARQLPQEAAKQAKQAVAKGRKQYEELARRGKDVDLAGQASNTAQGLMKQAGEIAGRGRKEAGDVVETRMHQAGKAVNRGRHQAEHMVEQGRHQAEQFVEQGRHQAEQFVEQGRHQAEHFVEQGRAEAEKRVEEGRRVANRTRRAAAEQADRVADQATQVVEAVSHVGRRPIAAAKSVTADVKKPMARRRRSPGTAEARPVVSAGVDAGATTPTAKKPAAKKATAKKAATKRAAASKPATKRAASAPAAGATKRTTKRAARSEASAPAPAAAPAEAPAPIEPTVAPPSTPSDTTAQGSPE